MDWKWLYTSFEGRISRKQFWIGVVVLAVVALVVYFVIGSFVGVSMFAGMSAIGPDGTLDVEALQAVMVRASWFSLIMFLIFLWPSAAVWIKRRHDRGSSGIDVWIVYGLQAIGSIMAVLGLATVMTDMGNGMMLPAQSPIAMGLGVITGLGGLYLLVVCGFLRGNAGQNAYGADPLAAPAD